MAQQAGLVLYLGAVYARRQRDSTLTGCSTGNRMMTVAHRAIRGVLVVDILLQWIGALALLGILLVIVPIFFMLIVTLQFRLIGHTRTRDTSSVPAHSAHEEETPPDPPPGRPV